jgi:hypothetical protein
VGSKKNRRAAAAAIPATTKGIPQCSIMLRSDKEALVATTTTQAPTMAQNDEEIQSVVTSDRDEGRIRDRRK